ncbi:MAG: glutathione-disulfide reductase [Gemmatimonas sp.]
MAYDFDLFVIGAGSGGVRASRLAGAHGWKVAVAECWTVGGTCVNRGCIPKKLYAIAAHYGEDFADAKGFGWKVAKPAFDWKKLVAAKVKEIDRLDGIYAGILERNNVRYMAGEATVVDPHTVKVGRKRYTTERILVATGSRPTKVEFPGVEHTITSDEVFDLKTFPRRVLVAGGGYIAAEMASIFNGLGAKTTLMYRGQRLLRYFDDDARLHAQEEMKKKGVTVLLETIIDRIDKKRDGLHVVCNTGKKLVVDAVLMAVGRTPNTHGLGLAEAGVELTREGAVMVDHLSRTSVPGIYAIGDCTDRLNLTPVAIHEAVCLIETICKDNPTRPDHRDVPTAVFSSPPLACVGMTEAEAREEFRDGVDVYRTTFRPLKHTLSGRDEKVLMKLVVKREGGQVVGAHMVGADAPEIIQALAVAVKAKLTKAQFDATMALHPTTAEEFVLMRTPS